MIKRLIIAMLLCTTVGASLLFAQENPRQPPPTSPSGNSGRLQSPNITFGGKVREEILENPYRFRSTPNIVTDAVKAVIQEKQLELDPSASRAREGVILTRQNVFAKGLTAVSELQRVSTPPAEEAHNWDSARSQLEIRITLAEANVTLVSVNALIEGHARTVLTSSWLKADSKGVLENEFLAALRSKIEVK